MLWQYREYIIGAFFLINAILCLISSALLISGRRDLRKQLELDEQNRDLDAAIDDMIVRYPKTLEYLAQGHENSR